MLLVATYYNTLSLLKIFNKIFWVFYSLCAYLIENPGLNLTKYTLLPCILHIFFGKIICLVEDMSLAVLSKEMQVYHNFPNTTKKDSQDEPTQAFMLGPLFTQNQS